MDWGLFYTEWAEWTKLLFYLPLSVLIVVGMLKRKAGASAWDNWIHAAVLLHFLVGAAYSGIRMLTTDPVNDMIVRRIFAAEAWFCFACAAFYFICMRFLALKMQRVA